MFFCAYLGCKEHELPWRETVRRHAAWLGLAAHLDSRPIADGRVFTFGWVSVDSPQSGGLVRETEEHLTLTTLPVLAPPHGPFSVPRHFETNAIRLEVSLADGEVRAAVPLVTTEQLYHAADARGHVFSDDMRLMVRWAGLELDERAVIALFQYHRIPAPLTISKRVSRIPNGYMVHTQPGNSKPVLEAAFSGLQAQEIVQRPIEGDPVERLRESMDAVLEQVPRSSVVFFSAGVDSGLLAARFAALGRKDVTLLHFSQGAEDQDTPLASEMAAHLGMQFERVALNSSAIPAILESLAEEYTFPYSDPATPLMMALVGALPARPGWMPAALTGDGTGMVFGSRGAYRKWTPIYAIPKPLRHLAAVCYRSAGMWKRDTRVSHFWSRVALSAQVPLPQAAAVMHTDLRGIAYDAAPKLHEDVARIVHAYTDSLLDDLPSRDKWALIYRLHWTGGLSAAKAFDPVRRRGWMSIAAFAEPALLPISFQLAQGASDREETKVPMRTLLARSVPRECIYRPRHSFGVPMAQLYGVRSVQEFIGDTVLPPQNPLMDLCRPAVVREIARRAGSGLALNLDARRFLWTLVFVSGWLQQLRGEL